ncbi:MAG: ABC transporter permease, partial [Nonlabens sp.]|nr:ABC transporter permease [Nonlabens sp.]
MDKLWLIIKREYLNKVRNRTFIIMTFVSPLIFVGVALLIAWLTSINADSVRQIAVLDSTSNSYINLFENDAAIEYVVLKDVSLEAAKVATEKAGYYGLLHISDYNSAFSGMTFYSKDSPSPDIIRDIENKVNKKATEDNLIGYDIDLSLIEKAKSSQDLRLETFQGITTSKQSSWIKIAAGGAAGYLLMMFIII